MFCFCPLFLTDENNSLVLRNPITGIKVRDYSGDDLHTQHWVCIRQCFAFAHSSWQMRTILQISLVLNNPITGIKVRDYSSDDLHTEHWVCIRQCFAFAHSSWQMRTILQISLVLNNPITGIKVRDYSGDDLHTEHIDENRRSGTHFLTQVSAQWSQILSEITSMLKFGNLGL